MRKIRTIYIIQNESGATIFLQWLDVNVAHIDPFHVTNKKAMGRRWTKAVGLRVQIFDLRYHDGSGFFCAPTTMLDINIVELNVFNEVARNAADNCRLLRLGIGNHNIADQHVPQLSYWNAFRAAHATA